MRSRLALVALSLVTSLQAAPVLGQTVGCGVPPGSERCQAWSARYNGPGTAADIASGAAISPDGSTLYVTGASPDAGGSNDAATVAYDASTGAQRWAARHVSAGGVAVTPSRDGERLFVLANAAGDLRTIAYDPADGEEVWSASFDAEGLGDTGIAVDVGVEDTRVYVTGYTTADGGLSFDYTTIAYDQRSGEELWVATYDGPASFWDVVQALGTGFTYDAERDEYHDRVYVTGRSNGASSSNDHTDFATIAYDGATGEELWVSRYDGPAHLREYAYALDVSDDGSAVAVTGESTGSGTGFDYATVLYDAHTGEQRWVSRYAAPFDDRPLGVDISPQGDRVYTTGFAMDGQYLIDRSAATVAYSAATGQQLWLARRTGPAGEAASGIHVSPDGSRVFVSGLAGGLVFGVGVNALGIAVGYSGLLAASYDADDGDERWAAHFGGVATDAFERGSALSPDGSRLYQVGGNVGDYLTVAWPT